MLLFVTCGGCTRLLFRLHILCASFPVGLYSAWDVLPYRRACKVYSLIGRGTAVYIVQPFLVACIGRSDRLHFLYECTYLVRTFPVSYQGYCSVIFLCATQLMLYDWLTCVTIRDCVVPLVSGQFIDLSFNASQYIYVH